MRLLFAFATLTLCALLCAGPGGVRTAAAQDLPSWAEPYDPPAKRTRSKKRSAQTTYAYDLGETPFSLRDDGVVRWTGWKVLGLFAFLCVTLTIGVSARGASRRNQLARIPVLMPGVYPPRYYWSSSGRLVRSKAARHPSVGWPQKVSAGRLHRRGEDFAPHVMPSARTLREAYASGI